MKRTNETGRSMVEMLGVLAIIGVLSIGGIAGYTMAMNRYRANEVLDMATKYATIVYTGHQTNKAMNAGSLVGYTVPSFCETGLVTATSTNSKCTVNGAEIGYKGTKTAYATISDDDSTVTFDIKFDSPNVCKAAASSLGGEECSDDNIIEFSTKQS